MSSGNGSGATGIASQAAFASREKPQPRELLRLMETVMDLRQRAQACGGDAMPYVHPKLKANPIDSDAGEQQILIVESEEERFCIRSGRAVKARGNSLRDHMRVDWTRRARTTLSGSRPAASARRAHGGPIFPQDGNLR